MMPVFHLPGSLLNCLIWRGDRGLFKLVKHLRERLGLAEPVIGGWAVGIGGL